MANTLTGVEQFLTIASATVAASQTAPVAGTVQSWTISSSTLPPATTGQTGFYINDSAAPSEMMLITNISGSVATVTRGADGTTPVVHTGPFVIQQVITGQTLRALQTPFLNVVTQFGADPTGATASDSAFASALAARPANGCILIVPPGTYKITTGIVWALGQTEFSTLWLMPGSVINYYGSGDCIRAYGTYNSGLGLLISQLNIMGTGIIDGTNSTAPSNSGPVYVKDTNFVNVGSSGSHAVTSTAGSALFLRLASNNTANQVLTAVSDSSGTNVWKIVPGSNRTDANGYSIGMAYCIDATTAITSVTVTMSASVSAALYFNVIEFSGVPSSWTALDAVGNAWDSTGTTQATETLGSGNTGLVLAYTNTSSNPTSAAATAGTTGTWAGSAPTPYCIAPSFGANGVTFTGLSQTWYLTVIAQFGPPRSSGLHLGDMFRVRIDDLWIQNFPGNGQVGFWGDNETNWSEQWKVRAYIENCSVCAMLDFNGAASLAGNASYDRGFFDFGVACNPGQDGVWLNHGSIIFEGGLTISGNFSSDATDVYSAVLRLAGVDGLHQYPNILASLLQIGVESDTGFTYQPFTIVIGQRPGVAPFGNGYPVQISRCYGSIEFGFSGDTFQLSNSAGQFTNYAGTVSGDPGLPYGAYQGVSTIADSTTTLTTTATAIANLTWPMGSYQAYRLRLLIPYASTAASGSTTFSLSVPGGIAVSELTVTVSTAGTTAGTPAASTVLKGVWSNASALITTLANIVGTRILEVEGPIAGAGSGTLSVLGSIAAGSTVTIAPGAMLVLEPQSDP